MLGTVKDNDIKNKIIHSFTIIKVVFLKMCYFVWYCFVFLNCDCLQEDKQINKQKLKHETQRGR